MDAKYTAIEVANWLLAWACYKDVQLTRLSLQKLLYFSQSHYLCDYEVPLFDEEILAFPHGPLVKEVWEYNIEQNPSNDGDYDVDLTEEFDFESFSEDDNQFMMTIWNSYGNLNANHLVNKSHKELPWNWNFNPETDNPKNAKVISKDFMRNYYQLREVAVAA